MSAPNSNAENFQRILRFEPLLLLLFVGALILRMYGVKQASIPFIIGTSQLAMFAVFKAQFTVSKSAKGLDAIFLRIHHMGLAIGLIAVLFCAQHWPGSHGMRAMFLLVIAIIGTLGVIGKFNILIYLNLTEKVTVIVTAAINIGISTAWLLQ